MESQGIFVVQLKSTSNAKEKEQRRSQESVKQEIMPRFKHATPKGITEDEFEQRLTVKPGDLEPIEGRPKYNAIYQVQKAVKENLAAFDDQREPTYGRMHLVVNTSTLPGRVAVAASTNQGLPVAWTGIVTKIMRENYLLNYFCDQEDYLTDKAAQRCMKAFILKLVLEVYFM